MPMISPDLEALRALLIAERTRHAQEIARIAGERDRLRRSSRRCSAIASAGAPSSSIPTSWRWRSRMSSRLSRAEAEEDRTATPGQARAHRKINRGALPAHLPREEVVVDVADKTCPCCAGKLHDRRGRRRAARRRAGAVPGDRDAAAQVRLPGLRRATVVQAPAPERLIEGGLPTEAMVAQVLVAKYADHLPLYRQAQIFARQGIELDRSTLADWVGPGGLVAGAGARPPARDAARLGQAVRRRDDGAGARSGARPDQDGPAVDLSRATIGRGAAAIRRRCLRLRAGSQGASGRAHLAGFTRHPAGRRLRRLCASWPTAGPVDAGLLLGARATPLLRARRQATPRRSPARRSRASPRSMPSRPRSAAAGRRAPRRRARRAASRSSRR